MQGPYTPAEYERYQRLQELEAQQPGYLRRKLEEEWTAAFLESDSKVSPVQAILHPIKTAKRQLKKHLITKVAGQLGTDITFAVVWKPLLEQESANTVVGSLIRGYLGEARPENKEQVFKALKKLADEGLMPEKVWKAVNFQKNVDLVGELIGNPFSFTFDRVRDYTWRKSFGAAEAVDAFKHFGVSFSPIIEGLEAAKNLGAVGSLRSLNPLRTDFAGLHQFKQGVSLADLGATGQKLAQEITQKQQNYQTQGVRRTDQEIFDELVNEKLQLYDQHFQKLQTEYQAGNIKAEDWLLIERRQMQDRFLSGSLPAPQSLPKSWGLIDPNTGVYNKHVGDLVENFFKGSNLNQGPIFAQLQVLRNSGHINDQLWKFLTESRSFLHLRTLGTFQGRFYHLTPSNWLAPTINKIYQQVGATKVLGKAVNALKTIRQTAIKAVKQVAKKVVEETIKVAAKIAAKAGIKIGLRVAVHAVTQAVGTAVPVVGNVVAFLATELVSMSIGLIWKLLKLVLAFGCGCFVLLISLVIVVIMGAFWLPKGGMDVSETEGQFTLSKRANPSHFDTDGKNHPIIYTITIKNNSTKTATNIIVNDETYDRTWPEAFDSAITLSPGEERDLPAFEETILADDDKIITNTARATVEFEDGTTTEAIATAYIIIGNPPDAPPCGWPVSGAVTLEFGVPSPAEGVHTGIDIGLGKFDDGQNVYSNVNGKITKKAYTDGPGSYGGFIRITSETGKYWVDLVHLERDSYFNNRTLGETIVIGQRVGTTISGPSGNSTGTHLHYRVYQDGELIDPDTLQNHININGGPPDQWTEVKNLHEAAGNPCGL